MSRGLFLLLMVATAFSVADGFWWDFEWSTEKPANCPHVNNDTHKCSTLESMNATCVWIRCCNATDEDGDSGIPEESEAYESEESESEEFESAESEKSEESELEKSEEFESAESEKTEEFESEKSEDVVHHHDYSSSCRTLCYEKKPCSIYKCYTRCCDGYEKDHYGRCRSKTDHLQCENGATLSVDYLGNYMCTCSEGFHGKSCEIPICRCENGGECIVKDGKPFCNCSYGHYGDRCEHSSCITKCQNGGTCYKNGTYEVCKCPHNYVGKYCEHYFRQPDTCPVPEYSHSYCTSYCQRNADCTDGAVCCKEGCTTICRKPKAEYCVYGYRRLRIGESFKPDPCKNCTCTSTGEVMCSSMSCRYISQCPDGTRPKTKPGECCPYCPDKPSDKPPVIYGCPTGVLYLNTTYYEDFVRLSERNTFIRSLDSNNRRIEVKYKPEYVSHCRCKNPRRKVTAVQAYATDSYGNAATCTFKVVVLDIYQPIFKSCPENIYVFENEIVEWQEPLYFDNVGVANKTCTDHMNRKFYEAKEFTVTYQIWDYDLNTAYCRFHVSVTPEDTDMESMPQGLRDRSKDKVHTMLIVGPVVGAAIIVGLIVLFLCCRRQHASRADNARGSARQTPAYDNNIYATPGDIIGVKLPTYSDLPMNPPPYTITGTEKDVAYMSLAPPSYTNPGYETLKVHLQRSDSLKSTKTEKTEEDSESTK